jgi:hypothetical protein
MKLTATNALVLVWIAGTTMVYGCVDSGLSAVRAFNSIGKPIGVVVAEATFLSRQDVFVIHEYTTQAGTPVVVVPDNLGCEIHYFVNAASIVSGYMFVGGRCTTYESDRFSERVLIPTGSTVDQVRQ